MRKTKNLKKGSFIAILAAVCVVVSGCQGKQGGGADTPAETVSALEVKPETAVSSDITSKEPASSEAQTENEADESEEASLYITLDGENFTKYPYDGEETPEGLIEGIHELTGWDLSLADDVTTGKGGITVMFAPEACLFTGPPEEQKDDFHLFDATQLTYSVLGSVQATLQNWANPTNPDSVDVYFGMGMDQALTLDNLGVTWPLDEPYSYSGMAEILENQQ